jgi:hypothetical protein
MTQKNILLTGLEGFDILVAWESKSISAFDLNPRS